MFTWKAHDAPVYDLAFTPDGRQLVTSSGDAAVRLWDVGTRAEVLRWPGAVWGEFVTVSSCGRYVSRYGRGSVVWGMNDAVARVVDDGNVGAVSFTPDDRVFVARNDVARPLRCWVVSHNRELSVGWGGVHEPGTFIVGPQAFNPDCSIMATLFGVLNRKGDRYESVVTLRKVNTGEEVGHLRPTENTLHATRLAFSPDGSLLAGIYGPVVIVWDVGARKELVRRQPSKKHFKGVAFTADGTRLLTASNDAVIQVWAAPNWQPLTTYAWKIGKLGCVAVSHDGTLAAAGGSSGKVVVWDLE